MRKRRISLIVIAIALLLVALAVVLLPSREPSYGGKRLTEWVESYEQPAVLRRGGDFARHNTDADVAIQHIGTNATAYLVKWIRYETPSWQVKCFGLVNRIFRRVRPSWQLTDSREQGRAVRALPALAALGPDVTIPEITRILNDPKAITRKELAVMAFGYLGKDGVPPLLNLLTNEHGGNLRYAALAIIKALGTNARAAGPVLLQYLSDKDWLLSAKVYYAIKGLEIDPVIAVPVLMETLKDTREDVQE